MPATNLLGADVASLDVVAFLGGARALFALGALAGLAVLARFRRPWLLVVGVLLANLLAWGATNYPLQRLYALGPSRDRVNNLGLVQVVAAGNSPLRTTQVGHIHFEPFWGLFVAALSGWNSDRVLLLYPFLPLIVSTAFILALYVGLRPLRGESGWSPWERALAAGFAMLLSSVPFDHIGTYRVPWVMMFLLKPNHALGLVLLPLVLRAFAGIRRTRDRLLVGLLLHLMGWAFVLHMAYVVAGLAVFAAWSLWARRSNAGKDVLDVLVVVGVNLLAVSPYLYILVSGYPFLVPSRHMTISPFSPHLLEATWSAGWLFPLAMWGLVVVWRRGDRLGRLWATQLLAAFLLWLALYVLSALQMARERDEVFYWIRFMMAVFAATGAWDLMARLARLAGGAAPVARAAGIALLVLPWSLPYWWDPLRMDSYFQLSLPPIPEVVRRPTDFLRTETPPAAVVLADPAFGRWVAALGARRALLVEGMNRPYDSRERMIVEQTMLGETESARVQAAAARYGIRYVAVTPALLERSPGLTLAEMERRPHFRRVHLTRQSDAEFVAILRLETGPR